MKEVIDSQEYLQRIKDVQSCNSRCICKANAYNKIMTHCPSYDDNVPGVQRINISGLDWLGSL
jgi:hypothetical protein